MTEERSAAIVRLLEGLDDGLPVLSRAPMAAAGFASGAFRESCPDCLANGFASRDCETCEGVGFLEGRRSRDPYDTGAAPGWFGSSAAKHERDRQRDLEIDRLAVQVAPARADAVLVAELRPEAWELERRRLRAKFDYVALGRALEVVRAEDPEACRALHAVYVYGWLEHREGVVWELVERGLARLDVLLPDPLRAPDPVVPAERRVLDRSSRNREIRRAFRDGGAAVQWLAQQHGLSVSQVNRILAGEDDPS